MSIYSLRGGHQVRLLFTGQEFFPALIAAIEGARHEVRLETYMFLEDAAGTQVFDALVRAAQRGVAVYLVVDGVGTPEFSPAWRERMQHSGMQWQQFLPLGALGLLFPKRWRRLHRKLCVVDGQTAFCGGINVLEDFHEPGLGPQTTARYDFAVQVQGPLVHDILATMLQFWQRLQLTRQMQHGRFEQARLAWTRWRAQSADREGRALGTTGVQAALILRDNVRNRNRIERAYRQAIARAKGEVVIANAYFLPGNKLRRALIHAAKRGVKVRLLLQGRYEYFMQFHAAKAFYDGLLDAGVDIHEYQAGYLHAKVAVVDGHWATVGSSNLDPLSLLLAREANVVIEDPGFASELLGHLNNAIERHSVHLNAEHLAKRPWMQRLKDQVAYTLMRIGLWVTGKGY